VQHVTRAVAVDKSALQRLVDRRRLPLGQEALVSVLISLVALLASGCDIAVPRGPSPPRLAADPAAVVSAAELIISRSEEAP
jgi:hypothetical protein